MLRYMSTWFSRLIVLGVVACIGAGCTLAPQDTRNRATIPANALPPLTGAAPEQQVALERESLGEGIEHATYAFSTSSRARLELYGFPAEQYGFRLAASDEAASLATWRDEAPADVIAGINAMYFLEDFSPAGFLVTEGEEQRMHVAVGQELARDFTGGLAPEMARAFARRPFLRALDT